MGTLNLVSALKDEQQPLGHTWDVQALGETGSGLAFCSGNGCDLVS